MLLKELIEKLQKYNPDYAVFAELEDEDDGLEVLDVVDTDAKDTDEKLPLIIFG